MRILGIDPGTRNCGYAVISVKRGEMRLLEAGLIKMKAENLQYQIPQMVEGLDSVFAAYTIDEVAMEDIFYAHNPKTVLKLAQFRGAIMLKLLQEFGQFAEYTPLQIKKALTGKAMEANAISKRAAWIVGIPSKLMVMMAFGLSTAMGGVAGVIIAPITMSSYDMGTMLGLKGFCAAVLGGLGSSAGAVVGGLILGILEALAAGMISSGYRDAVAFVLLLFVLFVKPSGILGLGEVKRS